MNEQTFQPGELVDITIRGARITAVERPDDAYVSFEYGDLGHHFRTGVRIDAPSVTVERQAPAEWPPLAGDLWRGRNDSLWFAYWEPSHGDNYGTLSSAYIAMKASDPTHYHHRMRPDRLLLDYGPLTLVHREHPDPDDDGDGE